MTSILDSFASAWLYWMIISFIGGMGGPMVFLIYFIGKFHNKKIGLMHVAALFSPGIMTFVIGFFSIWLVQYQARHEVVDFMTNSDVRVEMNDTVLSKVESDELISELKKVDSFEAHHSSPMKEFKFKLFADGKQITLYVNRDSQFENEYWIFWYKYKTTQSMEVGRIKTDVIKKLEQKYYF